MMPAKSQEYLKFMGKEEIEPALTGNKDAPSYGRQYILPRPLLQRATIGFQNTDPSL
jgi:hypothetical protein